MSFLNRWPVFTTDRGLTAVLWKDTPNVSAVKQDPSIGIFEQEDFDRLADDQVTVTALNSGTSTGFAKLADGNGTRSLVATTSADHRGAQVLIPALGSFVATSDKKIVVEFEVDLQLCSTFFIGLVEDGITILSGTSTLPTDKDYIGFYRLNGGVVNFVSHDDTAGTADSVQVLAADYYHKESTATAEPTKLGFSFDGDKVYNITVDGVSYKSVVDDVDTDDLPTAVLTPGLAAARGEDQDEADVRLDAKRYSIFNG